MRLSLVLGRVGFSHPYSRLKIAKIISIVSGLTTSHRSSITDVSWTFLPRVTLPHTLLISQRIIGNLTCPSAGDQRLKPLVPSAATNPLCFISIQHAQRDPVGTREERAVGRQQITWPEIDNIGTGNASTRRYGVLCKGEIVICIFHYPLSTSSVILC